MSLLSTLSAQPLGNRIVQCLGLAVAFGLGLWTLLLHLFYRKTLTQALLSAWVTPQSDQLLWQCVLGLCLFCGLLASGWLYRIFVSSD